MSGGSPAPPRRLGLTAGFLLLVATGYADAYTFLRHGHVFAEAMTGNLVLIGVGASDPHVVQFWRPLISYLAFVTGVLVLWLACRGRSPARAGAPRAQFATIAIEVIVLGVVGFLPRAFPQELIVAMIALAAGMQISAFRRVDEANLSTVVMTTNSMQAVGDVITALHAGDREALMRARALGVAIAGFVCGAFAGAALSTTMHDRAAWVDAAIYALAGLVYHAHNRRRVPSIEYVSAIRNRSAYSCEVDGSHTGREQDEKSLD